MLLLLEALPNSGRLSWVTLFLVPGTLQYNSVDKMPTLEVGIRRRRLRQIWTLRLIEIKEHFPGYGRAGS